MSIDTVPQEAPPAPKKARIPKPLIDAVEASPATWPLPEIDVDLIDVGPNVRVEIGQAELEELAASITEHGVVSPIKVTPIGDRYLLVYGQRRLLASRLAGRATIPAIVDDGAAARLAHEVAIEQLVENLQRVDLNPMDRARGMRAVVDAGMKQVDLARQLGLAPSTVANDLRLLDMAGPVQAALATGDLSPAHARAIGALDVDLQADFAERVVKNGYSAHETERQAKYEADNAKRTRAARALAEQRVATLIPMLEKVAQRKGSKVGVANYGGSSDVARLLEAAGWKVVEGWNITAVAEAGACGCKSVWRAEIPYNEKSAVELKPGCESKEHQEAARQAESAKWEKKRAADAKAREAEQQAQRAVATARTSYVVDLLTQSPADPFAQRLLLAALWDGDPDENLVEQYLGASESDRDEVAANVAAELDETWLLLEAIPDVDLPRIVAGAVAELLTDGWRIGPGAIDAIDVRVAALAPPAQAEAPAKPKGRRTTTKEG